MPVRVCGGIYLENVCVESMLPKGSEAEALCGEEVS